jgi:uncharacterized membrane protein
MNIALPLSDPIQIFALFCVLIGGVFWLSTLKPFEKFFKYLPPLIWCYFLPMLLVYFGVLSPSSGFYGFLRGAIICPMLLLLLLATDLPSILKLGPKALIIMLAGSAGVIVGGPVALLLFKHWLPSDAYTGMAALSGSWIGGSANMTALAESFKTPQSLIGILVVVDTFVGYTWLALVIALARYQDLFNRWNKADDQLIVQLNRKMSELSEQRSRPMTSIDVPIFFAVAFGFGFLCYPIGGLIADWLQGIFAGFESKALREIGQVFSTTTLAIILVSAIGLALSFTRMSRLEEAGASKLGYFGLYLMICTYGAQADLQAVFQEPVYLALGVVWISIHGAFVLLALRLTRAPLFFLAAGSQSNIGGPASAAVACAAYQPALAPVGVLLGVLGSVIGTYGGLLCGILCQLVSR